MLEDDDAFVNKCKELHLHFKDNIQDLGQAWIRGDISEGMFRSLWFSLKNDKSVNWPFDRKQECPGMQFFLKDWKEIAIHELNSLTFKD